MAGKKHYPMKTPLGGSTRGKDQDNRSVIEKKSPYIGDDNNGKT